MLIAAYYPPPTPFDQNPTWQAINKQLNANVQMNVVAFSDYPTKLATVMAGGDLPDVIHLVGGINGAPNLPQFLQSQCADLTEYLAGSGAKDYPNLAALPSYAWKNTGIAAGKIMMVPVQRPSAASGSGLFKNVQIYDKEIGADYVPKNADDFKRVLQSLNRPQQNRYATAAFGGTAFNLLGQTAAGPGFFAQMFGVPNGWRVEADGKLTRFVETPEFDAAVAYVRDLSAAGLFHPNSTQYNIISARSDFVASKWVVYPEAWAPWNDFWRQGRQQQPPVDFHMIYPFDHNGGQPIYYFGTGFTAATALKKASPDRVKELLKIFNWLAAPFGSQEDLLLSYGLKHVDYSLDDRGNPFPMGKGISNSGYVPWRYMVQHPQMIYVSDIPDYARTLTDAEQVLIPIGVSDPTLGFYSATSTTKGVTLNQALADGLTSIVLARDPLSKLPDVVKAWAANGGDQIRKEYMDAMATAK